MATTLAGMKPEAMRRWLAAAATRPAAV